MIYDEAGAMDYRFLEVNPVFEQQTGLKNVVGKLGSEVAPNIESHWFETYDNVLKTGNPQRIENYNQATDRWYSAYASRVGGVGSRQVCTIFSDITERKRRELDPMIQSLNMMQNIEDESADQKDLEELNKMTSQVLDVAMQIDKVIDIGIRSGGQSLVRKLINILR